MPRIKLARHRAQMEGSDLVVRDRDTGKELARGKPWHRYPRAASKRRRMMLATRAELLTKIEAELAK